MSNVQPDSNGWMPISTAPKDGTKIDLWDAEGFIHEGCRWDFHQWLNGEPQGVKSWGEGDMDGPGPNPTHWMPSPAPRPGPCKDNEAANDSTSNPQLPIARVAHEVVRNVALSYGDYSTPPWDGLDDEEKHRIVQLVGTYLATPSLRPDMLTVGIRDQHTRTKDYALYGVVRAIAQEQTRT